MTTPLTITSRNQGKIAPPYTSDETYWAQFREVEKPQPQDLPRRARLTFAWAPWLFKLVEIKR